MAPFSLQAIILLLAGVCLAEVLSLHAQVDNHITDLSPHVNTVRNAQAAFAGGVDEPLDLLDIVLVASVDGNLHALNRTSGHALWTISAAASSDTSPTLGPLVRTRHPDPEPGFDGEEGQEVYVIEPQSGEIYVMASPDSSLQRLPFTMPQLVEMSPYSMSGDNSMKVFVGKKETSLLLVELETGRIKATLNPNAECLWDPFDEFQRKGEEEEIDLDELEEDRPPRPRRTSTEVFIGRTGKCSPHYCTHQGSLPTRRRLPHIYPHSATGSTRVSSSRTKPVLLYIWAKQPRPCTPSSIPPHGRRVVHPINAQWENHVLQGEVGLRRA